MIDAAKADGSWTLLDDVEDLIVPPDLAAAFDRHPGSRAHWDSFPVSPRKIMLTSLVTAKRPETRTARIERIAAAAADGSVPTGELRSPDRGDAGSGRPRHGGAMLSPMRVVTR